MNKLVLTKGGRAVPLSDPAAKFLTNLVNSGVSFDTIRRAADKAFTQPKPFDAVKAVTKINQDLAEQGYPTIEGEPFIVERGTYVVCQVKVRLPRNGRSKAAPIYAYGYGFSKYNPNDDKLGMEYDPNVGRRLALSRAVTDCVNAYKKESNG